MSDAILKADHVTKHGGAASAGTWQGPACGDASQPQRSHAAFSAGSGGSNERCDS
jgi:hypothetical protein